MKYLILDENNKIINIIECAEDKANSSWQKFYYKAKIGDTYNPITFESLQKDIDELKILINKLLQEKEVK